MDVTLVGLPEDPEGSAVFLQELLLDLAEAAAPDAAWSASFLDDGLLLCCDSGRLALVGGTGFRLEVDGEPALQDALHLAIQRDRRVVPRIA